MKTEELIKILKNHDPTGKKEVIVGKGGEHFEIVYTMDSKDNKDVILGILDESIEFENDL